MADLSSIAALLERSEAQPLLWVGGFAIFLSLHLLLHPQARTFQRALSWMSRHPAPVLLFAASVMLASGIETWSGTRSIVVEEVSTIYGWPGIWVICLAEALRDFALVFHTALVLPTWNEAPLWVVSLQSLLGAFSQIWLCSYLIFTIGPVDQEWLAFRQALVRWRSVVLLAACQFPWWWLESQPPSYLRILHTWLLPAFLIFLAPLPLAIACTRHGFIHAGVITLRWWGRAGIRLLGYTITAIPLLTALQYTMRSAAEVLPAEWYPASILLESLITATMHVWLFITGAALMLPGGLRQRDFATAPRHEGDGAVEG